MELDQAFRKWVRREHMRLKVIAIDWCLTLALVDHFLHLFVLLLKRLDVSINLSNTVLIVVNLIIKDLVMRMDCYFTINKGIDGASHLSEVFGVHLIELN